MLYLAIGLIVASGLFVVMRMWLRDKALTLQQFFLFYGLALLGMGLVALGVTGRLHWLFALLGGVLPFLAGLMRWAIRAWRAAGVFRSFRQILKDLTGLGGEQRHHFERNTPMSVQEAMDILGLEGNPTEEEIKIAHRKLIQKIHPDRGGSTLLAKQVNEAKQVLMNHV